MVWRQFLRNHLKPLAAHKPCLVSGTSLFRELLPWVVEQAATRLGRGAGPYPRRFVHEHSAEKTCIPV